MNMKDQKCNGCGKEFPVEELNDGLCSECDKEEGKEEKTYSATDKQAEREKEKKRQLDALVLKKKRHNMKESRIASFEDFVSESEKLDENYSSVSYSTGTNQEAPSRIKFHFTGSGNSKQMAERLSQSSYGKSAREEGENSISITLHDILGYYCNNVLNVDLKTGK